MKFNSYVYQMVMFITCWISLEFALIFNKKLSQMEKFLPLIFIIFVICYFSEKLSYYWEQIYARGLKNEN